MRSFREISRVATVDGYHQRTDIGGVHVVNELVSKKRRCVLAETGKIAASSLADTKTAKEAIRKLIGPLRLISVTDSESKYYLVQAGSARFRVVTV